MCLEEVSKELNDCQSQYVDDANFIRKRRELIGMLEEDSLATQMEMVFRRDQIKKLQEEQLTLEKYQIYIKQLETGLMHR